MILVDSINIKRIKRWTLARLYGGDKLWATSADRWRGVDGQLLNFSITFNSVTISVTSTKWSDVIKCNCLFEGYSYPNHGGGIGRR